MIKLFGFGPEFGVLDPSPFVIKIDIFMRMAGIQFEAVSGFGNIKNSPKGKLPYIDDGGRIVADSFFIQKYLEETYKVSLDAHLSEEQKATAHLIIKCLEGDFYWCMVRSRWLHEESWAMVKEAFFGSMPFPLKTLVPPIARRSVKKALLAQGMGKHSDEEMKEIAKDTLESLSVLLSDKECFFGAQPTTLDVTAYAFLAEFILSDFKNPLTELAKSYDNLVAYCERINAKYYGADSMG